ncbi:SDR family NAD(P)-dependent oxidoreductase, partial [Arthrobacter sp. H41]|uniref:SDR family NAD(P)-dependent oxidoreductase n=1 Tax=Arthrobacter sp. H41 TaxID=1312978 RepID=UPI0020A6880E
MNTCTLVTGAGRGIGAAVAQALAAAGHRIAVHTGSDEAAARRVLASLPGEGHAVVVGDLSSPEVCERIFAEAVAELGDLDVLVNNAGVFEAHPVDSTTYADWQQAWRHTLDVNLLGPANLSWLMVDHLMRRARGPAGGRLVSVG